MESIFGNFFTEIALNMQKLRFFSNSLHFLSSLVIKFKQFEWFLITNLVCKSCIQILSVMDFLGILCWMGFHLWKLRKRWQDAWQIFYESSSTEIKVYLTGFTKDKTGRRIAIWDLSKFRKQLLNLE